MYVAKKRIVEYQYSGMLNYGMVQLHNILDAFEVNYTTKSEDWPEEDDEFEINRQELQYAYDSINTPEWKPNEDELCAMEKNDFTKEKLIETFKFLLEESDQSQKEWIYVSFF